MAFWSDFEMLLLLTNDEVFSLENEVFSLENQLPNVKKSEEMLKI